MDQLSQNPPLSITAVCAFIVSAPKALQFIKDELGDTFPYKAVRSYSTRVRENGYIIPYNPYKKKWNEVYPSPYIQICVWDKDAFLIENLQIIEKHP